MIENRVPRFYVAQKVDERNRVGLRTRQRAHDEIEIGCRKPRATVRTNHRDFIMRKVCASDKRRLLRPRNLREIIESF
jgi:hypothetical protein